MHRVGVRGIRLNLMSPRISDTAAARTTLQHAASRVAPLGWHVQIYGDGDILRVAAPILPDLPVPVVFDHMGGARLRIGTSEPGFRTLCDLLAKEQCWAKLSGADIVTENDSDPGGAVAFARALVAANPQRLVWVPTGRIRAPARRHRRCGAAGRLSLGRGGRTARRAAGQCRRCGIVAGDTGRQPGTALRLLNRLLTENGDPA